MTASARAEHDDTQFPPVDHWEDSAGHSATVARLEIHEIQQFLRADNRSGFRQAVQYLAGRSGIALPVSERACLSPVFIIAAGGGVQFYDGRHPGGRKWHQLVQPAPGTYRAVAKGSLDGDEMVILPKDSTVYFGVVSDRGATAAPLDAGRPAYEVFRRVAEAAQAGRHRLLGGIAGSG